MKLPWLKPKEQQPRRRADVLLHEARREVASQQPNQFQRNRTLPQQPKDQSVRSQAHQLRTLRRRILLIVAFGAGIVVISLFVASQLITSVRVSLINTENAVDQSQQAAYKKVIDQYLDAHPFHEGLAMVSTNEKTIYIDKNGNIVKDK